MSDDARVRQTLRDAAALLRTEGWQRHSSGSPSTAGKHDVYGAIYAVVDGDRQQEAYLEAYWAVQIALDAKLKTPMASLARWNDHIAKDAEEVAKFLEEVADAETIGQRPAME